MTTTGSSSTLSHQQGLLKKLQDEIISLQESVIYTKRECEEKIARYELQIADRKRRMNDFVPAATLIPELLQDVFDYCRPVMNAIEMGINELQYRSPYEWIQVTHVCHRWREVALLHANLWNEIYADRRAGVEMIRVFHNRSKESLLHLYYDGEDISMRGEFLRELLQSLHRVRSLHIHNYHEEVLRQALREYPEIASIPTPELKRLALVNTETSHVLNDAAVDILDCPNIVSLYMSGCRFNITQSIFRPSLQELRLTSTSGSSSRDLLRLLARLPNLRILELDAVFGRRFEPFASLLGPSSILPVAEDAQLGWLRELYIRDKLVPTAHLLQHIVHPSSTLIKLYLRDDGPDGDEIILALADAIAPSFSRDDGTHLGVTVLDMFENSSDQSLQAWSLQGELPDSDWQEEPFCNGRPLVDITIITKAFKGWEGFVPRVRTQDVRRLRVDGIFDLAGDNEWLFAVHFPSVEALSIRGVPHLGIPTLLQLREEPVNANTENHNLPLPHSRTAFAAFPLLSSIQLRRVPFSKGLEERSSDEFLNTFVAACAVRQNAGYPIHSVQILMCINVSDEDITELEKVIPDVYWDKELEYQQYDEDGDFSC